MSSRENNSQKGPFKTTNTFYRKVKKYKLSSSPQACKSIAIAKNSSDILEHQNYDINKHENNSFQINTCFDYDAICEDVDFGDVNVVEELDNDENKSFTDFEEKISFVEDLRIWALSNRITHCALSELLGILKRNGNNYLPKSSKTLLSTPHFIENLTNMRNGQYWHNGIQKSLVNILQENFKIQSISLIINIDGLPIAKSSKTEFWPILCSIYELPNSPIITAGIFCGEGKPPLQEYLQAFVDEMSLLYKNGLLVNNQRVSIKIKCFVCDSPARAFVKGIVNFNSYHGCNKYTTTGCYENNRMSFPKIDCRLRTDEDFRKRTDPDHHKETSPFESFSINMIDDFLIADSLHLLDLGVMKKLLIIWSTGMYTYDTKWSAIDIKNISKFLIKCNENIPKEIHRSVRALDCLKFWKGLEYRTFLLYLGPVVLKDFLKPEIYKHFLYLFCAVTICSAKVYLNYVSVAEELFNKFIEQYIDIYGPDTVTSNVHNLCHVVSDVIRCGPLPNYSSYKFENHLGYIKNLLRQGHRPLAQCAKRLLEFSKINTSNTSTKTEVYPHPKCEIISADKNCPKKFSKIILAKELMLTNKTKDKWFMTKQNEVVCMLYTTYTENELKIFGSSVTKTESFFEKPFKSTYLNICISKDNFNQPALYSLNSIKCKLICLEYQNNFVFFPLLHTLELLNE